MAFVHDLRYAARAFRRSPGFSAAAIATLAIGIGATTAVFSVVNSVVLRPLPYRDSGQLAFVWTSDPAAHLFERPTGYRTIQDWREQARSVESFASFREEPVVWSDGTEPESIEAGFASANLFAQLGVAPVVGRTFTQQESDAGERLAVLGYELWQRRFGGAADAIGKTVHLDGKPARIVGVLPAGFRPPWSQATRLWMPESAATYFGEMRDSRTVKYGWSVIARLRPGVGVSEAQAEISGISARLAQANPNFYPSGVRVVGALDQVVRSVRLAMSVLLAAVLAVLLIACANLGNLVLARGAGRQREVAVRTALGASRGRLISQLFAESLALAGVAGCAGLALAFAGVRAILAFAPAGIPRLQEVSLDVRAVLFAVAASLVSAALFGLAPAARLASGGLAEGARTAGAGRSARRMRDALVIAECALAIMLLAGAGLLIRSMNAIVGIDPGFHASGVLTVVVQSLVVDKPDRFAQLTARIESLPGALAAGGISRYFQVNTMRSGVRIVGRPADPARDVDVNYDVLAGHFLQAVGAPLLRGRYFTAADGPDAPRVVLVNQAFVNTWLPGEDPIGKSFLRGQDPTPYTIVGVIGDMRRRNITSDPIPEVLWPHAQRPWGMALAVRSVGDPLALAPAVRETIRSFDPSAVIQTVTTLDRQLDDRIAERRFQTRLLGIFAGLALLLAVIGVFSLMHYAVSERTREIGVRVALGAQGRDIFDLVLGHAAKLVGIGLALGVGGALWVTRALSALLYGVTAHDPATYAAVGALLAVAALAAGAIPARRATRSDPLTALRHE
jgi:predicted permease